MPGSHDRGGTNLYDTSRAPDLPHGRVVDAPLVLLVGRFNHADALHVRRQAGGVDGAPQQLHERGLVLDVEPLRLVLAAKLLGDPDALAAKGGRDAQKVRRRQRGRRHVQADGLHVGPDAGALLARQVLHDLVLHRVEHVLLVRRGAADVGADLDEERASLQRSCTHQESR